MATTVKTDAVRWLLSKCGERSKAVYASKFYIPEESWTRRSAWWFEIPQPAFTAPQSSEIHLLCQVATGTKEFYYLKVPAEFFLKKLQKLYLRRNGKVSLFLSAESEELFVERRGTGSVDFGRFLMKC